MFVNIASLAGPAILALGALCASPLPAQQTHHRATPAHSKPAAAAPKDTGPALPPGVPPAPGTVETAFALRYIDIKAGEGAAAEPGQFYTVQYTGWLASDGTKFDSSLDRSEPITFPQGVHRVIPGWDGGFTGMHVGGKRRLFIPYQLAYGEQGRPPVIPPKSDLIFDIELVAAGATPPPPPEPAPAPQPSTPPPDTQQANPDAANPTANPPASTSPASQKPPQPQ